MSEHPVSTAWEAIGKFNKADLPIQPDCGTARWAVPSRSDYRMRDDDNLSVAATFKTMVSGWSRASTEIVTRNPETLRALSQEYLI